MRGMPWRWIFVWCCLWLWACSGFTEVDGGPSSDSRPDIPAGQEGAPAKLDLFSAGGTGPGPRGALPSGYCCTADTDCRYRDCQLFNGSQICMDPCQSDDACKGSVPGLHCNKTEGRCEPLDTGASCVPAEKFTYGAKQLGACCLATHDGWSGFECEGNHCGSFHDMSNPYICIHTCDKASDCLGAFGCLNTGYGYSICGPQATTYSCTP